MEQSTVGPFKGAQGCRVSDSSTKADATHDRFSHGGGAGSPTGRAGAKGAAPFPSLDVTGGDGSRPCLWTRVGP